MMKIAVNKCFGGFSVTEAIFKELGLEYNGYGFLSNNILGIDDDDYNAYRADKRLISAIEKIGEDESSGDHADIQIIEIPDDVEWEIDEYDGIETIHEKHRSW